MAVRAEFTEKAGGELLQARGKADGPVPPQPRALHLRQRQGQELLKFIDRLPQCPESFRQLYQTNVEHFYETPLIAWIEGAAIRFERTLARISHKL